MRFLHMADAHLGYRQYHSDERQRDFARAFLAMCQRAIAERCELVLIAGDLFHGTAMDPRTFLQAVGALRPLWEEGIDVVAIAGNHDRARKSHGLNWLHALQGLDYLKLLEVGIEDGELSLGKAIYETDEIRVIGIPYVGMALPQLLPQIAEGLEGRPQKFTVLMLHAGLEGEIPGFRAALSMEALEPLRPYVDYLALGHIHKPYTMRDGWIFNPGSLETVSIDETQWPDRGGIIVEVENREASTFGWAIPDRRPFLQFAWPVGEYEDPLRLIEDLRGCMADEAMNVATATRPVVELRLEGTLTFDRRALDTRLIERILSDLFKPIVCRVRDLTESDASEITVTEDATRAEIERQVVRELVARDASCKEHADAWTAMLLDIKDMALARSDPERIIEEARGFRRGLTKESGSG